MIDIRAFRRANRLKQEELAEFLGVTRAFISMVENGTSKLPQDKLNLLLSNQKGWETSALMSDTSIVAGNNNGGSVNVQIGQNRAGNRPKDGDAATQIAVLEKENEMLREQLEFMKTLISPNKE